MRRSIQAWNEIILTVKERPRRGRPPDPNRPRIIADAVLRVLAEEGTKGLTHRRVDCEAGLPIGSTIHHAPMRSDLFTIAVNRLNEMTLSDLKAFRAEVFGSGEITTQSIAHRMVELWRAAIEPERFYRLRAEMAVIYSHEHQKSVQGLFQPQLDEMRKFWADAFTVLGVLDPERASFEFVLWNRGIFSIVASCDGHLSEDDYGMIERWIIQMVQSLVERGRT